MTLYFAVHVPKDASEESPTKPTDLQGLATSHGVDGAIPRWLKAWSPDLHDDRLFTLWEADDAESIVDVLKEYGFLDDMVTKAFQVTEWGPDAVLTSQTLGQQ
jgi:hypothetical protein